MAGQAGAAIVMGPGGVPVYAATWGDRVVAFLIDQALVAAVYVVVTIVGLVGASVLSGVGAGDAAGGLSGGFCCIWLSIYPLAFLGVGAFNRVYLVSKRDVPSVRAS